MSEPTTPAKISSGVGAVRCTYPSCTLAFRSAREMKNHKRNDPVHDYCSKCDVDCDSWDDYVEHKANANPKIHIACLHCGQDFKSIPGRNRHIAQIHPVDQQIPCSGCKKVFARASSMIAHIEKGLCKRIGQDDFQGHIQHKKIIRSILEQPERTIGKPAPVATPQAEAPLPIPAEASQFPKLASTGRNHGQDGPKLVPEDPSLIKNAKGAQKNALDSSVGEMQNLGSNLADISLKSLTENSGEAQRRDQPTGYPTQSSSGIKSPTNGSLDQNTNSDAPISKNTQTRGSKDNNNNAPATWKANASNSLFPKAEATPMTQDWEATLEKNNVRAAQPRNMFRVRFWDPLSDDYDPDQFYDAESKRYRCPIPDCRNNFAAAIDLEQHILATHRTFTPKCPHCHRVFKSTAALVAHCETPYSSRCNIARSDKFGHIVDSISGGLLAASEEARPDQADVTFVEYRAAPKPAGLRGRGWGTGTGRGGRGWHKKERTRGGAGAAMHGRNQSGSGGGGKARGNRYWDEGWIEERGVTVIGSGGGKGDW